MILSFSCLFRFLKVDRNDSSTPTYFNHHEKNDLQYTCTLPLIALQCLVLGLRREFPSLKIETPWFAEKIFFRQSLASHKYTLHFLLELVLFLSDFPAG